MIETFIFIGLLSGTIGFMTGLAFDRANSKKEPLAPPIDELEIERQKFLALMNAMVKDVNERHSKIVSQLEDLQQQCREHKNNLKS